jgi:hypothetical protein
MSERIKPIEVLDGESDNVYIDDVTIEYVQDGIDNEDSQILRLSTGNNGVARYINIHTEKFSIADIDELVEILEDFKNRANL